MQINVKIIKEESFTIPIAFFTPFKQTRQMQILRLCHGRTNMFHWGRVTHKSSIILMTVLHMTSQILNKLVIDIAGTDLKSHPLSPIKPFRNLHVDDIRLKTKQQPVNSTVKSIIQDAPNPKISMFLVSSRSCLCPIHWRRVLSREWRRSLSSADRRCSNYIWVFNRFITYQGAAYIRCLTAHISCLVVPWLRIQPEQ